MAPGHWYWKKRKQPSRTSNPFIATAHAAKMQVNWEDELDIAVVKDKGLAIEPIVASRTFDIGVCAEPAGLYSINGVYWPPRQPLIAYCMNNAFVDHETPHVDCMCGIYAWKTEVYRGQDTLWGEVYLWGDVLVCEYGYRAEMAYPKSLHITATSTRATLRIRDALEETYGVPVTLTDPHKPVAEDTTTFTSTAGAFITSATYQTLLGLPPQPPPPAPPGQ